MKDPTEPGYYWVYRRSEYAPYPWRWEVAEWRERAHRYWDDSPHWGDGTWSLFGDDGRYSSGQAGIRHWQGPLTPPEEP